MNKSLACSQVFSSDGSVALDSGFVGVFLESQSGQARFIQVKFFTITLIFYVVGDKKSLNREGLKTISNVGFIFDLDGTLLDSASQIVPAVIETRLFFKMPILGEEEVYRLIGRPAI
jgi:hypothetical protein